MLTPRIRTTRTGTAATVTWDSTLVTFDSTLTTFDGGFGGEFPVAALEVKITATAGLD